MEIFKSINSYPDYEISNTGKVRSIDRQVYHSKGNLNLKGKPVKMRIKNYGYVCLTFQGKSNNFYIHRLVALHFIDNPEKKHDVNHIDGNRANFSLSNLEWISHRDNVLHARRVLFKNIGEKHHKSKLDNQKVREIREAVLAGAEYKPLAKKYSVTRQVIASVVKRKTWIHVV